MLRATIHEAKTHLSRLLKRVQRGEKVIIVHGKTPVAQIVPIEPSAPARPRPGKPTTTGVRWTEDAFQPMSDKDLESWGL